MKQALVWLAVVSSLLVSSHAVAQEELAKTKNCMACHAVSAKVLGPSFRDVAAKYANQDKSESQLVQKVVKGGGGVWGQIPMPPNLNVSEAEARRLVKWILAQK